MGASGTGYRGNFTDEPEAADAYQAKFPAVCRHADASGNERCERRGGEGVNQVGRVGVVVACCLHESCNAIFVIPECKAVFASALLAQRSKWRHSAGLRRPNYRCKAVLARGETS